MDAFTYEELDANERHAASLKEIEDLFWRYGKFSNNPLVQKYIQHIRAIYHDSIITESLEKFAEWLTERPSATKSLCEEALQIMYILLPPAEYQNNGDAQRLKEIVAEIQSGEQPTPQGQGSLSGEKLYRLTENQLFQIYSEGVSKGYSFSGKPFAEIIKEHSTPQGQGGILEDQEITILSLRDKIKHLEAERDALLRTIKLHNMEPTPRRTEEGQGNHRWVKASERLPEKQGKENSVVIRCTHPTHRFVTVGFRNYSDSHPALYMEVGRLSFLTVWNDGNFHSSVPIGYIEWLENTEEGQGPEGEVA